MPWVGDANTCTEVAEAQEAAPETTSAASAHAAAEADACTANAFATWQDDESARAGGEDTLPRPEGAAAPTLEKDLFANTAGDWQSSDERPGEDSSEDEEVTKSNLPTPPSPLVLRLVAIVKAIWTSPVMKQFRMTLSVANVVRTTMRLPAMIAVVVTQLALVTSQAGLGIGLLAPGATAGIPAMLSGLPML